MYVCICNAVTDREIRQAVELGASTFRELREGLGVATGCGRCKGCARDVLREALSLGGGSCEELAAAHSA